MATRGEYLTKLRIDKGWKKRPPLVAALKKEGVEITAEAIRQYENDEAKPKPKVRAGLAKVYGVSPSAIEFGGEQPQTGHNMDLSPREEIVVLYFRGLLDDQQRELLTDLRALFDANNYTRKQLGVTELKGVSNARVEQAFGKVPEPSKSRTKQLQKRHRDDNPRGAPVDDE